MTKSPAKLLRFLKLPRPNTHRTTVSAAAAKQRTTLEFTGDAKTGRDGALRDENIRSI